MIWNTALYAFPNGDVMRFAVAEVLALWEIDCTAIVFRKRGDLRTIFCGFRKRGHLRTMWGVVNQIDNVEQRRSKKALNGSFYLFDWRVIKNNGSIKQRVGFCRRSDMCRVRCQCRALLKICLLANEMLCI